MTDDFEVRLARQNRNPVKVLTSGHERPTAVPFEAGGRLRDRERVRWWEDYADDAFCVFGHYWRTPVPKAGKTQRLFDADPPHAALGAGRAMCIDYSAGARWLERLDDRFRRDLCHPAGGPALAREDARLRRRRAGSRRPAAPAPLKPSPRNDRGPRTSRRAPASARSIVPGRVPTGYRGTNFLASRPEVKGRITPRP